jgi:hypothetical protein
MVDGRAVMRLKLRHDDFEVPVSFRGESDRGTLVGSCEE